MNTPGLFLAGGFVTLILAAALALLSYAAILDGRYAAAQKRVAEDEIRTQPELLVGATVNGIPSDGGVLAGAGLGDSPKPELLLEPAPVRASA